MKINKMYALRGACHRFVAFCVFFATVKKNILFMYGSDRNVIQSEKECFVFFTVSMNLSRGMVQGDFFAYDGNDYINIFLSIIGGDRSHLQLQPNWPSLAPCTNFPMNYSLNLP